MTLRQQNQCSFLHTYLVECSRAVNQHTRNSIVRGASAVAGIWTPSTRKTFGFCHSHPTPPPPISATRCFPLRKVLAAFTLVPNNDLSMLSKQQCGLPCQHKAAIISALFSGLFLFADCFQRSRTLWIFRKCFKRWGKINMIQICYLVVVMNSIGSFLLEQILKGLLLKINR